MKPIAVVHWMEDGKEKKATLFNQEKLDRYTRILRVRKCLSWICMCSGQAATTPRKREGTVAGFKMTEHTNIHPSKTGA